MNKPELEPFLTDIIWGIVIATIMGVLFYHTVYPPAYRECEAEAAKTDSSFLYTTFRGCVIFNNSSQRKYSEIN